ncbi:MAG: tetratricopeptide repeat protein [Ignavibacteria bacterium]|nr:tetratricopeptide repeat protein [Ignavibacteria bacterium]
MERNEKKYLEHLCKLTEDAEAAKKLGNWLEVERLANVILTITPHHELDSDTHHVENFTKESSRQLAQTHRLLSESLWRRGTYSEANKTAERAIEFAQKSGNHTELIQCLSNMGTVLEKLREYKNARKMYDQALILARDHGDRVNIARLTGNIGILHLSNFEYQQALVYFQEALEINTELDRKEGMARNLGNIGIVYY